MKTQNFKMALLATACAFSFFSAQAHKTVYGSGGVVDYPNGTSVTCPNRSTAVCATYNNLTTPRDLSFSVRDAVEITLSSGDKMNVEIATVNEDAFNRDGDIQGNQFSYVTPMP